ncbi:MAG: MFS transporter [Myxococcota bacterium]
MMILVSTMLVMSGQGIIAPVLPLFASEFGAGAASVGLTLSIFALARLLLNVPLGLLSDRYGRRMLLVGGPVVNALGMIGSGLSPGIGELLAWRFVAGAGSAMYMTGAQIYLADISAPRDRARVIGTNQAALLVGVSIGPGIGGLLADSFGLRVPFYAVGFGALVAAAYGYLRLPETGPSDPSLQPGAVPATPHRPWLEMMRSRDFLAVSAVTASVFLTRAGGRMTLMPLLAASELGYSVASLGGLFTVMAMINLVGIAPAAVVADRFGRKWAIVPSGLIIGVALVLMAGVKTPSVFLMSALLLAVGSSIIGPAPAAYAVDLAPRALRGLAMGLYRSAGDLGFTLGPVLLGLLADNTSIGWALAANAAIVVGASIFFGLGARETLPQIDPVPDTKNRDDLEVRVPRS